MISLGFSTSESYKDVDIVNELRDRSTSMMTATAMESLDSEIKSNRRSNEIALSNSRVRFQGDRSVDCDSGHDDASVPSAPFAPFSKPAPSKWDDADKWIASPQSNRLKTGPSQGHAGQAFAARKAGPISNGNRQSSTRVVMEVPDQKVIAVEEVDTKRIDPSQCKKEGGGKKFLNWAPCPNSDSDMKPTLLIENPVADSAGIRNSLELMDSSVHLYKWCFENCCLFLLLLWGRMHALILFAIECFKFYGSFISPCWLVNLYC